MYLRESEYEAMKQRGIDYWHDQYELSGCHFFENPIDAANALAGLRKPNNIFAQESDTIAETVPTPYDYNEFDDQYMACGQNTSTSLSPIVISFSLTCCSQLKMFS